MATSQRLDCTNVGLWDPFGQQDSTYPDDTWSDGSDATSVSTSPDDDDGVAGDLATASASNLTSLTIHARASSTLDSGDTGTSDYGVSPFIHHWNGGANAFVLQVSGDLTNPEGSDQPDTWRMTPDGTIRDYAFSVVASDLTYAGYTLAQVGAFLAGGDCDLEWNVQVAGDHSPAPTVTIYEAWVELGYDLPCDTTVDLDLSTAVFLTDDEGNPFGQYVDGVICTTTGPGGGNYPDFYFPGLTLDPAKPDYVQVTYDSGSSHDAGGREVFIGVLRPGHEQDDLSAAFAVGQYAGGCAVLYDTGFETTGDVQTFRMGPGRSQGPIADPDGDDFTDLPTWNDGTLGVVAGYTVPWFETDYQGAVSAISIRKVCTIPPLRLTNRDDEFGPTLSLTRSGRSRQGGNRLTGYL